MRWAILLPILTVPNVVVSLHCNNRALDIAAKSANEIKQDFINDNQLWFVRKLTQEPGQTPEENVNIYYLNNVK